MIDRWFSGACEGIDLETVVLCENWEFYKSLEVCEGEQGLRETKVNPASMSLGLITDRPVSKEPPAARTQGPSDQCKNPEG